MKLGSRHKAIKRLYWRLATAGLLVLALLLCVSVYERYKIERNLAKQQVKLEADYQALLKRKVELTERVNYLRDDRSHEAEIRRNFNVAKDGEQVVVILENKQTAKMATDTNFKTVKSTAPWYIFWR